MSAKLRGLDKIWASVWDSINGWLKVSVQGSLNIAHIPAMSATISRVSASVNSATLLEANPFRLPGTILYNDSLSAVYIKFGLNASSTSFTCKIQPAEKLELSVPGYTGVITGAWVTATGAMCCTELVQ